MIFHTNIEKYTILYTIMHEPQMCTIKDLLFCFKKIIFASFSVILV